MLRRTGLIALLMVVSLPVNAETDDIKEWHKQIYTQLMSNTRFPPAARGQTGTAKVGFVLDRQGKLVSHWLAESTGNRVLDEESLAVLERTKSFPMPPPGLKEDHLTLAIPFDYRPRPGSSVQSGSSGTGTGEAEVKGEQYLPRLLSRTNAPHALCNASVTPPSVSTIAATSRRPSGSPRISAAEITPISGTSSMPVEADDGGRRRNVSNQVR